MQQILIDIQQTGFEWEDKQYQVTASRITTDFIHYFKLIDIKVGQHMRRGGAVIFGYQIIKSLLESASIEKPGEPIMTTLVTEFAPQFTVF